MAAALASSQRIKEWPYCWRHYALRAHLGHKTQTIWARANPKVSFLQTSFRTTKRYYVSFQRRKAKWATQLWHLETLTMARMTSYPSRYNSGTHLLVQTNSCLNGLQANQQEKNYAWSWKPSQPPQGYWVPGSQKTIYFHHFARRAQFCSYILNLILTPTGKCSYHL